MSSLNIIRKAFLLWFACACFLSFETSAAPTTVGMSIKVKAPVELDTFYVELFADSVLTTRQVYAYRFGFSYTSSNIEFLGIDSLSAIAAPWGMPVVNNTTASELHITGAGATPLTGSGRLFLLKFVAKRYGWTYFSTINNANYLNEGAPALSLSFSNFYVTERPKPYITPNEEDLYVGEKLKMWVWNGTPPYTLKSTNNNIVSILDTDSIIATGPGSCKVYVTDALGQTTYTSGSINVHAAKLDVLPASAWPNDTLFVPVRLEVSPAINLYAGSFTLTNSSSQLLGLPQGIKFGDFDISLSYKIVGSEVRVSFASSKKLTGSGILCYVPYISATSTNPYISLQNILLNESLTAFSTASYVTVRSFPTLYFNPNGGEMLWGDSMQISVTNGTPPITYAVSDSKIASISSAGYLYAKTGGTVRVIATDDNGASRTSNDFKFYHNKISIANSDGVLDMPTRVPVVTSQLPAGKPIYSFETEIGYDSIDVKYVDVESAHPEMVLTVVKDKNRLKIVGASGKGIYNGTLFYLVYKIENAMSVNDQTYITIHKFSTDESNYFSMIQGGLITRVEQASYRPVANAGKQQFINEGDTAFLNGLSSYDLDGDSIKYLWQSPQITLSNTTSARPYFICPQVNKNTNFTFTLVVSDSASSSDPSSVIVTVLQINKPPVANAGPDMSYLEGSSVSLNGSESLDPDEEKISYKWVSLDGIILFDQFGVTPSFIAPQVNADTKYRFALTVKDASLWSKPDTITITVLNLNKKPTAYAGADQVVNESDTVYLNAFLSSDPDGDMLTYKWFPSPDIMLSSDKDAKPFFVAPAVYRDSIISLSLLVNDGKLNSNIDFLNITIKNIDYLSLEAQIKSCNVEESDSVVVDSIGNRVLIYLPYGYDIRTLAPTFEISNKATIFPQSGTVRNFVNAQNYSVTAEDGITKKAYTVKVVIPSHTMSRKLDAGWNWLSLNVYPENNTITSLFGGLTKTNLDYLKAVSASSVYYSSVGWFGDLVSFPSFELVKHKNAISQPFTVSGSEINPTITNISISNGWNRIGYLLKQNEPLSSAFVSATLPAGEIILKSKNASAIYYPGSGWIGDLDTLHVLNGYMMKSTTSGAIRYNSSALGPKSTKITQKPSLQKILESVALKPSQFEHSATVIAEILDKNGNAIVAESDIMIAKTNFETRGVATPYYVSDLKRHLFVVTLFANKNGEEIEFELNSELLGKSVSVNQKLKFKTDSVYGTPFYPVQFHLSEATNAITSSQNNAISIFPNPVADRLHINSQSIIRNITIYTIGGAYISSANVSNSRSFSINTQNIETGLYIVRITTAEGVFMRKFEKSATR